MDNLQQHEAVINGRRVGFHRQITTGDISARKLQRFLNAVITILMLLMGVLGLGAFVLLYKASSDIAPWVFVRAERGDPLLTFFAASLLTDAYCVYRFVKDSQGRKQIDREPAKSGERLDLDAVMTEEARRAVEEAWRLAFRFRSQQVTPSFLFASLFSFQSVTAVRARLGADEKKMFALLQEVLEHHVGPTPVEPVLSNDTHAVLQNAYRRAWNRRADRVDVSDLYAACASDGGAVTEILDALEVTPQTAANIVQWIDIENDLRRSVLSFRHRARFKPKGAMNRAMTAIATPLLDRVSTDLTALARRNILFPCVARDKEIEGIFRLIEGGENVLLIGNPGVGKDSVLEGIAQRMVTEDVPKVMQDKRLVNLSVSALVGGSAAPGDVEARLQRVLVEVLRSGNIFLVVSGIQNLIGVSTAGGATFDLSEMLAEALTNRGLRAMATTTPGDFRRTIEGSGIRHAFATLALEETDTNQTIITLEAHAGPLEYRNQVFFTYRAIERIVAMSNRYMHDRFQPAKALLLMEEVAVYVRKKKGKLTLVLPDDVAVVVADRTHIAVSALTESEREKLLSLEERLHQRIVGQHEAVTSVSSAMRRSATELRDPKRPIAAFLFVGPTGVGKTELAKAVAEVYFGNENAMIRLDMSEYQDATSMERLLGSPSPTGRGMTGGFFVDAVQKQPFSLILLDEFEKANRDILNLFLQVFDDGRLTDGLGRTIDFTNAILIATSNAGTAFIQESLRNGAPMEDIQKQLLEKILPASFPPELLNRFNHIAVFKPLSMSEVTAVAKLLLGKVAQRLTEKGILFRASEAAVRELAQDGYDPLYGARPLRRLIEQRVDDALARYLLTQQLSRRDRAILEPGGAIHVEPAGAIVER